MQVQRCHSHGDRHGQCAYMKPSYSQCELSAEGGMVEKFHLPQGTNNSAYYVVVGTFTALSGKVAT